MYCIVLYCIVLYCIVLFFFVFAPDSLRFICLFDNFYYPCEMNHLWSLGVIIIITLFTLLKITVLILISCFVLFYLFVHKFCLLPFLLFFWNHYLFVIICCHYYFSNIIYFTTDNNFSKLNLTKNDFNILYLLPFVFILMFMHVRTYVQPYSMRVSIDLDLRVGSWYIVRTIQGTEACMVHWQKDMLELCEPKILAFDIECEKAGNKYIHIYVSYYYLWLVFFYFFFIYFILFYFILFYDICIFLFLTTLIVLHFYFKLIFLNNHHDFYFLLKHSIKVS